MTEKKHTILLISLICILTITFTIINENLFGQGKKKGKRPRIGLVLSGGGAKGLAHVGVLQVLEELGIRPDYITGTSMGSIVGGLYASGFSADHLSKLVVAIDWDEYLGDQISRRDTSIDEKADHDKYMGSFPIRMWDIELPKGYKRGQKLTSLLTTLTLHVHHIKDFKKLPIPFLCIGTDIVTGEAVILDKGHLAEAMRASMAIPSIFTPMEIGDHLLVDGGVVRNLPVQDVREMGADIIIAVDVGAPLYKKEELSSIAEIMDQSVSFLGAASTRKQRLLTDILVLPNIKGFSSSEFKRGPELIKVGREAAMLVYKELKKIADDQKKYNLEKKELYTKNIESMYVKEIKIEGLKKVSKNLLMGKLLLNVPKKINPFQLSKAIARVYASRFFHRVGYYIEPIKDDIDSGVVLVIKVVENTDSFLKFGFSYDLDRRAAILLNTTFRNKLGQGSKLSIDARLSENPGFKASYFIHTAWRKPGIGFGTIFHYDKYDIYTYSGSNIQASYDYQNFGADLIVQAVIFNDFALGGGVQKDFTTIDTQISPEDPEKRDIEALNYYGYVMFDNLDKTFYPRSGFKFYGEVKYHTDDLSFRNKTDAFEPFYKFTVKMVGYIPFHKTFSMFIGISGAFLMGREPYYISYNAIDGYLNGWAQGWDIYKRKTPFIYQNYIGGLHTYKNDIFHFTGLNFMQISGRNVIIGYIGLQIEPIVDKYIILRGNVGRVKNRFSDLFKERHRKEGLLPQYYFFHESLANDLIYGYGLTLGVNTIIGPIELTIMRGSESNKFMLQINVGYRI